MLKELQLKVLPQRHYELGWLRMLSLADGVQMQAVAVLVAAVQGLVGVVQAVVDWLPTRHAWLQNPFLPLDC